LTRYPRPPSIREVRNITGLPIFTIRQLSGGRSLRRMEKKTQSEEHRWLVLDSRRLFRRNGWRVKHRAIIVKGTPASPDYYMLNKDNEFFFVEALSQYNTEAIAKKFQLNKHAPVIIVCSENSKVHRVLKDYKYLLVLKRERKHLGSPAVAQCNFLKQWI